MEFGQQFISSEENRPEHYEETFATLQAMNPKVGRAWAIKGALRTLWTYRQSAAVKRFFTNWYGWAVTSAARAREKARSHAVGHLDGVPRFVQHPITNGVAEGLNRKIMNIKRKAGGFRNPANVTTAIYFHCGHRDVGQCGDDNPRQFTPFNPAELWTGLVSV
jgi:transposase